MDNQHLHHIAALCDNQQGTKGLLYGLPIVIFTKSNDIIHAGIQTSRFLAFDGNGINSIEMLAQLCGSDSYYVKDAEWFAENVFSSSNLSSSDRSEVLNNALRKTGLREKDIKADFKCPEISFGSVSLPLSVALQFKVLSLRYQKEPIRLTRKLENYFSEWCLSKIMYKAICLALYITESVVDGELNQDLTLSKSSELISLLEDSGKVKKEYEEGIKLSFHAHMDTDFESFYQEFQDHLAEFSIACDELPAYNQLQLWTKQVCASIGSEDFETSVELLKKINSLAETEGSDFIKEATLFQGSRLNLKDISNTAIQEERKVG